MEIFVFGCFCEVGQAGPTAEDTEGGCGTFSVRTRVDLAVTAVRQAWDQHSDHRLPLPTFAHRTPWTQDHSLFAVLTYMNYAAFPPAYGALQTLDWTLKLLRGSVRLRLLSSALAGQRQMLSTF